jgi:hypothetical protein
MDDLNNLLPQDLYHSYIIEGEPETGILKVVEFLEKRGEISKKSSNLLIQNYDSFKIEDSYKIKNWHSQLAVGQDKKICIIGAKFLNHEAEKTLLKIFEEPAFNTHFFLIIPNCLVLVETLRSRAQIIKRTDLEEFSFHQEVNDFISMNLKDRIYFIDQFLKKNKDQENSLRFTALQFINNLESKILNKLKLDKKNLNLSYLLKEIQQSRGYLNSPGASVKMILEHLALIIDN